MSAAQWDALGPMLPCPGYSDEVIHCFLARELTPWRTHRLGTTNLEVLRMPAALDAALASGVNGGWQGVTAWFAPTASRPLMTSSRVLFWHRRDLRLADNLGLVAATEISPAVTGVYVVDPQLIQPLEQAADGPGPACRWKALWNCSAAGARPVVGC